MSNIKHNVGHEILENIRAIKQGKGKRFRVEKPDDIKTTREHMHFSQSTFAAVLGVSIRTLQDWEQGRRKPSGAANSLLLIAKKRPEVIKQVFRELTHIKQ